jgi:hypothetical protein
MDEKEENRSRWNLFVEIGKSIHNVRGVLRIQQAKLALQLSNQLIENHFISQLPFPQIQLHQTLLPKIAEYLDGDAEFIKNAVREYFLLHHSKSGQDESLFDISFSGKGSGIQLGLTCKVQSNAMVSRYFVKTHQFGRTKSNPQNIKAPDVKELLIYIALHRIGLGPEPHFIVPSHGTKRTLYIATKEVPITLLSSLNEENANPRALIELDLISRILCLRDTTTNPSNCGQLSTGPMIIDFRIEKQSYGYEKPNLLKEFLGGNTEFGYESNSLMGKAVFNTPHEEKIRLMRDAIRRWALLQKLEECKIEMEKFLERYSRLIEFENNDMNVYVADVKKSINYLLA